MTEQMVPTERLPWLLVQRWDDLLFAHWAADPLDLRDCLPRGVEPDTYEGRAWLAIVAFRMLETRPALAPARATLQPIPELNVRTYVRVAGVPAVWFLSLDASSPFFVGAGRALYGLPYRLAHMAMLKEGGRVHYLSSRGDASFAASYEPCGPPRRAVPGSLEHFLVERYRLFSLRRGRLITAVVAHEPWGLQPARAEIEVNRMAPPGLSFAGEPVLHFSASVAARISVPQPVPALESDRWSPRRAYARQSSARRSRRTVPQRA